MSRMIPWFSTLTLLAATLAGCNEARSPRAAEAQPAAPAVVAAPAQAPAPVATVSCPAPAVEAPPAKAARPAPAARRADAAEVAGKLKIKRLVLADEIKGREPVEPMTKFHAPETDRIYAFVEVENGAGEETEITVEFEPPGGGSARGNVTLDVGASPRWRTWAFTRGARVAGAWTAVVRAPDGKVLARAPFDVTL